MRSCVVSDTHLPRFRLPELLVAGLRGVNPVLHLGDFTGDDVPALFEAIAPLEAGIWYLNPGSPTDKRRMPDYTYAILQDGVPTIHHVQRP